MLVSQVRYGAAFNAGREGRYMIKMVFVVKRGRPFAWRHCYSNSMIIQQTLDKSSHIVSRCVKRESIMISVRVLDTLRILNLVILWQRVDGRVMFSNRLKNIQKCELLLGIVPRLTRAQFNKTFMISSYMYGG